MSGCWLWTGGTNHDGYGMFGTGERTNRPRKDRPSCATRIVCAHRWSWEFHRGPIPQGLTADHLCRVRSCVNPRHLELVTNAENVLMRRVFVRALRLAEMLIEEGSRDV